MCRMCVEWNLMDNVCSYKVTLNGRNVGKIYAGQNLMDIGVVIKWEECQQFGSKLCVEQNLMDDDSTVWGHNAIPSGRNLAKYKLNRI